VHAQKPLVKASRWVRRRWTRARLGFQECGHRFASPTCGAQA